MMRRWWCWCWSLIGSFLAWAGLAWAADAAQHGTIEDLIGSQWLVRGLIGLAGALLVLLYRQHVAGIRKDRDAHLSALAALQTSVRELYESRNADRMEWAQLKQRCDDTHGPPRHRSSDPQGIDPRPLRCNEGSRQE